MSTAEAETKEADGDVEMKDAPAPAAEEDMGVATALVSILSRFGLCWSTRFADAGRTDSGLHQVIASLD